MPEKIAEIDGQKKASLPPGDPLAVKRRGRPQLGRGDVAVWLLLRVKPILCEIQISVRFVLVACQKPAVVASQPALVDSPSPGTRRWLRLHFKGRLNTILRHSP